MLLAAGLLTTACSTYETDDPLTVTERSDMATLRINVYTPGEMSTRAEGQENATAAERQIHSIRVYAYLNESECTQQLINDNQLTISTDQLKQRCVGYAILSNVDGLNVNEDLEYTWAEMGLPRYTINKKLDFYAMANMEGERFDEVKALGFYPTRNAVETCKFTAFGTAKPVSKEVPEAGLPASRILKGLTPVTSLEGENCLSITLLRAVGKVRFFFAKPQGLTGAQVTGIKLNTGAAEQTLPASALVMPTTNEETDGFKVALHNTSVTLPASFTREATQISYTDFTNLNKDDATGMKEVEDPEVFVKGGKADAPISENFSQYISRLETNTTEYADGLTYIRESDGKIYGTVSYKLSAADDEKTANFELYTADNETHAQPCFPRNHYSVVYAYFKGDKELYVKPTVADWIDTDTLNYTMKLTTNMRLFDSWLYRYDTDGDYNDYTKWATSHMVVSSGLVAAGTDGDVENRPLRSPQIQLVTTTGVDDIIGAYPLHLVLDNTDDFQFVKAVKEGGVITSCTVSDAIDIAKGENVYTYFYIIPKSENVARTAKVMLFYDDPVLGRIKVTFNYNALPGYSDDSSEIWVYSVAPDDYNNANGDKLKMYYQDINNPLVPTADQN